MNNEETGKELPVIADPTEYFRLFRESTLYKNAYEERLTKITPDSSVSQDEIKGVFEESDDAKGAFLKFAQQETGFHYDPDFFPPESVKAVKAYIETVTGFKDVFRDLNSDTEANQDLILYSDHERSKAHDSVAYVLWSEEVAPSKKLAKALVNLVLIEKKLDTFSNVTTREAANANRQLGL